MEELTRLRSERGWSQQRLAGESGVNKATINQIERGRRSPNVETLEKLARAMGAEVGDFFPKAQAPLPLDMEGQRGAPEQAESTETFYTAYEALGRVLASGWEDDLKEWEEKIPAEGLIKEIDFGRLLEWTMEISHTLRAYETIARDSYDPQRDELADTLKLMENAVSEARKTLKRAFEPVKTFREFRQIWEANDLDVALNDASNNAD